MEHDSPVLPPLPVPEFQGYTAEQMKQYGHRCILQTILHISERLGVAAERVGLTTAAEPVGVTSAAPSESPPVQWSNPPQKA